MPDSHLLVFGPQRTSVTTSALIAIRHQLRSSPPLHLLATALRQLPAVYGAISAALPSLASPAAASAVQDLTDAVFHGARVPVSLSNTFLAPLSLVADIASYDRHIGRQGADSLPRGFDGVTGLCTGVLSAAVCAISARHHADLGANAGTALRLALLVGLVVDAAEARLSSFDRAVSLAVRCDRQNKQSLDDILSEYPNEIYVSVRTSPDRLTLTLPERLLDSVRQRLGRAGVASCRLALTGSFHSSRNATTLASVLAYCKSTGGFCFAGDVNPTLPLWSDSGTAPLNHTDLHARLLSAILVNQSQWSSAIHSACQTLSASGKTGITAVGEPDLLPQALLRSASSAPLVTVTSDLSLPNGHQEAPPLHASVGCNSSDVAVIGMACRFPDAPSVEHVWDFLSSGQSACRDNLTSRFGDGAVVDNKWVNLCSHVDAFDPSFFNVTAREALYMDPQQRMALEVAYEALQDAHWHSSSHSSSAVGCYLGVGATDYQDNVSSHSASAFSATGTLRAFISGKISHYFGWTGPSMCFDTACSSSLVAIHSACIALRAGECEVAVAGGVNVISSPALHAHLDKAGFLSRSGASKSFDASADGYCRGEGAGLVVLKPLAAAIRDQDEIRAVISGSAVNQGSNKSPITVPSLESQIDLYKRVMTTARIGPTDVSYIEAHGTGTQVGDPIEMQSIRAAFGESHRAEALCVGSVKANFGHLESASGVAGLIKAILMLQKKAIPPQANFNTLNPKIAPLAPDKLEITTKGRSLPGSAILVNNYGAAGNNAALVVRCHDRQTEESTTGQLFASHTRHSHPMVVSAPSVPSLLRNCRTLSTYLHEHPEVAMNDHSLASFGYQLQQRSNMKHDVRISAAVSTRDELSDFLEHAIQAQHSRETSASSMGRPIVLCFGGQVGDMIGLDQSIYDSCTLFRDYLNDVNGVSKQIGGPELFPHIFERKPLHDLVLLQTALFAVQYASAKSWISCGASVKAMIGHSFGYLTALCVSGTLDLQNALSLVQGRAALIQKTWHADRGRMVAVECPQSVATALAAESDGADIACYNGPTSFVFAGASEAIKRLVDQAKSLDLRITPLDVTHAYHSQLTDPILPGLFELASVVRFKEPNIHVEACTEYEDTGKCTARKVMDHLRQPVFFHNAVQRLIARFGSVQWLEAGVKSNGVKMTRHAIQLSNRSSHSFQASDLTTSSAWSSLAQTTASINKADSFVLFWPYSRVQSKDYTPYDLPPFQFERRSHWLQLAQNPHEKADARDDLDTPQLLSLISSSRTQSLDETLVEIGVKADSSLFEDYVAGHMVAGKALCPASLYASLASKAAQMAEDPYGKCIEPTQITGLRIRQPLTLPMQLRFVIRLRRLDEDPSKWGFSLCGTTASPGIHERIFADGAVLILSNSTGHMRDSGSATDERFDLARIALLEKNTAETTIEGTFIYKMFAAFVTYRDYYRGVQRLSARGNEIAGRIALPDASFKLNFGDSWDPLLLDNALQVAGLHANCLLQSGKHDLFICVGIDTIDWYEPPSKERKRFFDVACAAEVASKTELTYNIGVFHSGTRKVAAALKGVHFVRVNAASLTRSIAATSPSIHDISQSHRNPVTRFSNSSNPSDRSRSAATPAYSDKVMQKARSLLSSLSEIPEESITADSALPEIGIDSLMMVEASHELESGFSISIAMHELQSLDTFGSLCAYIKEKLPPTDFGQPPESPREEPNGITPNAHPDNDGSSFANASEAVIPLIHGQKPSVGGSFIAPRMQPQETIVEACLTFDNIATQSQLRGFDRLVYPRQSSVVIRYIVNAFEQLGCPLADMSPGDVVRTIPHTRGHEKLLNQLLRILNDAGLIHIEHKQWRRSHKRVEFAGTADEMLLELKSDSPQHAYELDLLELMGPHLAECLSGKRDGVHIMFGSPKSRALVEAVYAAAPMFFTASKVLSNMIRPVLLLRSTSVGRGEPIRLIEIGAGTGATSRIIIALLKEMKIDYEYTFTDISTSLTNAAKAKFAGNDRVNFKVVDIETPPQSDSCEAYDVVISTNAIHATKSLRESCTNIHKLLRSQGMFFLVELTRNLPWFDITFGLLEGWWHFEDGRQHALASEKTWEDVLASSGFSKIKYSSGDSSESDIIRVFAGQNEVQDKSPPPQRMTENEPVVFEETLQFDEVGPVPLYADISYPKQAASPGTKHPIALMIHGGGHVMLSRKDIRPQQRDLLLSRGFVTVSPDHRLCPEVDLISGPIHDVSSALGWCRNTLPQLNLQRNDIHPDGSRVVVVGWSTGGHLALSTAWAAPLREIAPPNAILTFYTPVDFESPVWSTPQFIFGLTAADKAQPYDLWTAVRATPLTGYNVREQRTPGGWLQTKDPRARIPMHMNWSAQTLPILLGAMTSEAKAASSNTMPRVDANSRFPDPDPARVREISPLAHARAGTLASPVFLAQGTADDFIEWQTVRALGDELVRNGVDAHVRLIDGGTHLFEAAGSLRNDPAVLQCVADGYEFLCERVGLGRPSSNDQ